MKVNLFNADGKFTPVFLNDDKSRVCGNEEKGTNCTLKVLEIGFHNTSFFLKASVMTHI